MERRAADRHNWQSLVAPLFVPGDRVDRAATALQRGARVIVLDLEDAVPPANKPEARSRVAGFLGSVETEATIILRVNAPAELLEQDLVALGPHMGAIDGMILAKTESADEVARLLHLIERASAQRGSAPRSPWIMPTIENAVGLEAVVAIASAPAVLTLLFGSADLSADLGTIPSAEGLELLMAQSRVVHACALAKVARPIDGAYLVLDDDAGLEISARHALRLGYGGKAVIHPKQVPTVERVFSFDEKQVAWASRVVDAFERSVEAGVGVVRLDDGTFIDAPVAERARAILRGAHGNRSSVVDDGQ